MLWSVSIKTRTFASVKTCKGYLFLIYFFIPAEWVFDGFSDFRVIELFKLKLYFKIPKQF